MFDNSQQQYSKRFKNDNSARLRSEISWGIWHMESLTSEGPVYHGQI